ncbi:MAG: hypothetical protein M3Q48_05690 [Actinomycetota bacterium]|nr:hypothetical protein [Actinomycetota bacterium]
MGTLKRRRGTAAAVVVAMVASLFEVALGAGPAGAGLGGPSRVAVFDDPVYVDTSDAVDAESDNVQASLTALGHTVTPFTGVSAAEFEAALASADVLVVPELERRDLAADLSDEAKAAIAGFVAGGGSMVVFGAVAPTTQNLLNAVFGFSVSEQGTPIPSARQPAAEGTEFAGEAATLPQNDGMDHLTVASLPAGARSVYGDGTRSTVAVLPHGAGSITYLGWDWFASSPPSEGGQDGGWQSVLDAAVERPAVSVADITVNEGDAGTTSATFTLTLSGPVSEVVSVDYATAAGTATAGADFTATSGTASFARGETTTTVVVPVLGDRLDEPDETFTVDLTARFATLARTAATATIVDDDPPPALSVGDLTVAEPASGTATGGFTVSLSEATSRTVTVSYATADATATAPADYTATSGTLTFAPGETSASVAVPVLADEVREGNETFLLRLAEPVHATVADGEGTATITDREVAPPPPPPDDDPPDDDKKQRRSIVKRLRQLFRYLFRHHGWQAGGARDRR